jgi:hypothetical protein
MLANVFFYFGGASVVIKRIAVNQSWPCDVEINQFLSCECEVKSLLEGLIRHCNKVRQLHFSTC